MKRWGWLAAVVAVVMLAEGAMAAPADEKENQPGVDVTVYNQNFALVKDRRQIELKKGLTEVRFTDVAATIDPTSVRFVSVTDPAGTGVVEQNYEFDLVNADKVLQKYIDKPIKVFTKDGNLYEGVLMSFDGRQIVLAGEANKGISMVERGDNIKNILFSKLPEGLLTRPTLVWTVSSEAGGRQLVKVSYVANAISWRADYTLVSSPDDKTVDMSGWVTINNQSGTTYPEARIKLLAGETAESTARRQQFSWGVDYYKGLSAVAPTGEVGAEKGERFSEYYLYRLPEPSTINNNQVKQIELLNARSVPVQKIYVFDGAKMTWYPYGRYFDRGFGTANKKVNVLLQVQNSKKDNMGFALPQGKVRVYKRDTDGSLEFIGEDSIPDTPRDEKMVVYIGDAFDIVGERKQTDFRQEGNTIWETFRIEVKNHKETPVTVKVLEKMYRWAQWEITEKSQEFTKLDSRAVEFPVAVPKDGAAVVTYTVKYSGW